MVNNIPVVIVAAVSRHNRAIGKNNQLLWHIPADMRRFKELTIGKPIIMGRKTFESIIDILGKPLPERKNIVVTRNTDFHYDGVVVAHSLEDALTLAAESHPTEIHIGGGAHLYAEALPIVDRLHITWVDDEIDGDAHFPAFEDDFVLVKESEKQNHNDLSYQWSDYQRKNS